MSDIFGNSRTGATSTRAYGRQRNQQRLKVLAVIERAKTNVVIDLTEQDSDDNEAASEADPPGRLEVGKKRLGTNLEESPLLESSPKRQPREKFEIRPESLVVKTNGGTQTYNWGCWDWCRGWTNIEDGTTLSAPIDLDSVVEVGVQPATGYPARCPLTLSEGGYVGPYGEDGDGEIVVDLAEVTQIIWKPWLCTFVGYLSY